MRRPKPSFEVRCANAMRLGMIHGVIAAILLIAFVFATGSTFGQRCAKAHPGADAATIDACVEALSQGTRDEP